MARRAISALGTLALALCACTIPDFQYPPGPPSIDQFQVLPFVVRPGSEVRLEWTTSGADRALLRGLADAERSVPASGTLTLQAERSSVFELEAFGAGGSSRARAAVEVKALLPVEALSLSTSPELTHPGGSVRVSWRTLNATQVSIDSSDGTLLYDGPDQEGTVLYHPNEDATLNLRADGDEGPRLLTAQIEVRERLPLILDFSAWPVLLQEGSSTILSWSVEGAGHVTISELAPSGDVLVFDGTGSVDRGQVEVTPPAGARSYRLVAESGAGQVQDQIHVQVTASAPPAILELTVTPTVTGPGGQTRLRWRTVNATLVELYRDGSLVFPTLAERGELIWLVTGEQQLSMFAHGDTGQLAMADVFLSFDGRRPAILVSAASPSPIQPGEQVSLLLNAVGADRLLITTDAGVTIGSSAVSPLEMTTHPLSTEFYTMRAENVFGATEQYSRVIVYQPAQILSFTSNTSVVRNGRWLSFFWSTDHADRVQLVFGGLATELSSPVGSIDLIASQNQATLIASNLYSQAALPLSLTLLPTAFGAFEEEPNGDSTVANGPYPLPFSINGDLPSGDDRDLFVWSAAASVRPRASTLPPGGCPAGQLLQLEVYEDRPQGPLGPRVTVISDCPQLSASTTPELADMEPPLLISISPAIGNLSAAPAYVLGIDQQVRVCGDNITDLREDCDDGNFVTGDGCTPGCTMEGADLEPNDSVAVPLDIGSVWPAYMASGDSDNFLINVGAADAGAFEVSVDPPFGNTCAVDLELELYDVFANRLGVGQPSPPGCKSISGPGAVLSEGYYRIRVSSGPGLALPRRGPYRVLVRRI